MIQDLLYTRLHSEAICFTLGVILLTFVFWYHREDAPFPGFKLAGKKPGDWLNQAARKRWETEPTKILKEGFKQTGGRPFQVMTEAGPLVMIPTTLCDEIRSDHRLSFGGFLERQQMTNFNGLDVLHLGSHGDIIQGTIRKHLTQALGGLTEILSEEAALVLNDQLPAGKGEWQQTKFVMTSAQVAAHLSARVLLGERLCHNKEWIDISIAFSIIALHSQASLRAWPVVLRPLVHRVLPQLRYLRSLTNKARAIIEPELADRRNFPPGMVKPQDALSWLDEVRGDQPFDVVSGQLFLTFAAIHTTSTVLTALMYDIIANPEYIDLLREEIVSVLKKDGGWKKTSLYKMKLMDSCMKESQRLNILGHHMMNRRVEAPITLSDGTYLAKGVHLTSPDKFDGHRFLRMREQPGQENKWQFVSTSPQFLSFGHGKHACPGRFFASNEIKIALAHLILRYDWRFIGDVPRSKEAHRFVPDPDVLIAYRARDPEVQL
ncbi:P450 monooxygenase [Ilyonectria destructans]|nr:P450 monooxygenase [Ilyonectria destructans]